MRTLMEELLLKISLNSTQPESTMDINHIPGSPLNSEPQVYFSIWLYFLIHTYKLIKIPYI